MDVMEQHSNASYYSGAATAHCKSRIHEFKTSKSVHLCLIESLFFPEYAYYETLGSQQQPLQYPRHCCLITPPADVPAAVYDWNDTAVSFTQTIKAYVHVADTMMHKCRQAL